MAFTEKYVSVAGGGAHDGSSEANAWTFEEAIAAPVGAGNRVNVKAGTHTLTAARTLPNGTTENPIEWRGYNSTIGDLEDVGRDSSGELDDTNFPIIDCTASYNLTIGGYCTLKNLTVTSGLNGVTTPVPTTGWQLWRCRLINTHASGVSARIIANSAVTGAAVDCDMLIASTSSAAIVAQLGWSTIVGCRIWHSGTPNAACQGIALSGLGASASHNVIYNMGIAILISANGTQVTHNSWYNVATGLSVGSVATAITGNVGWTHSGYAIIGTAASGNPLIWNNAIGSYTSGRIDTGTLGTIIEEKNAITLTADPFTNSGSGDFTLNNTSGGGALCRAVSKLWTGYGDLGAMQTQATGGGSALHLGSLGQTGIGAF